MNRRQFIASIGGAVALSLWCPPSLLSGDEICRVYQGYPQLNFTGWTRSQVNTVHAGQFLWAVLYQKNGTTRPTYWEVTITAEMDYSENEVWERLKEGQLETIRLMDEIIKKAHRGFVEIVESATNPNFDFAHWEKFVGDDEHDCEKCQRRIVVHKDIKVQKMKLVNWDELIAVHPDYQKLWEM